MDRIWLFPLLFQNGCSQSRSFFLPLVEGNEDSGNEIACYYKNVLNKAFKFSMDDDFVDAAIDSLEQERIKVNRFSLS